MSILAVANCPGCGKVFQRNLRNLCMDCIKSIDHEFDACYRFMLHNRKASTEQLRNATGVSKQRLTEWIKDKRLSVADFPSLTYPCNSCGSPIHQHNLCFPCSSRLSQDIRELQAKEAKKSAMGVGFYSLDRGRR
ncbi:flagellar protein [Paenibacillus sp. UNC451MF]|uniref:flagellar protein n=1 Tax=Paenibacillus sp. UNC451MF TaxID=1449063 RepID=UPI0009DF342A|nr:flagellar protein [Paenibacillus sp. UNC451MF]